MPNTYNCCHKGVITYKFTLTLHVVNLYKVEDRNGTKSLRFQISNPKAHYI